MSNFFVKQKIGKNIYIYEVTSHWDAKNKTTKQKRKYIGKLTDSGEIVTPKKSVYPVSASYFGATYLFEELSKKIGLYDLLNKIFPDKAEIILSLAIFFAIERKDINDYLDYTKHTHTTFKCNLINFNDIISLFKDLTDAQTQRSNFLKLWQEKQIQSDKSLYIDIKRYLDKSTYKKQFYKTDKDLLFTYRMGLVLNKDTSLPLSYCIYPNRLIDANDIKKFTSEYLTNQPKIFFLDSDFSNISDIVLLNYFNIKFILPYSENVNLESGLLKRALKYNSKISDHNGINYFFADKILYFYNTKLKFYLFFNEKEKLSEADNFIRILSELESLIKLKTFNDTNDVKMFMNAKLKNSSKYYEISVVNKKAILKKKKWVISHKLNNITKVSLISNNTDLGEDEILLIHKIKHNVEGFFNLTIMDTGKYSLFVKPRQIFEGELFIQFISLILFSTFETTLKTHELLKEYTIEQILNELKNLKMISLSNNKNILSEKNKLHKDLFKIFDLKDSE
ncbi:hypothetical protein [Desulfurella sp.]|uniref:hypothetical protein n=1 Tax=Desulfurella sp. TaxID=1962857 RepID=UPI003D109266